MVILNYKSNAHKKAFIIGGHFREKLFTCCFRCAEIKVWDINTLNEEKVIPIKIALTGKMKISFLNLYISSGEINGIECAQTEDILK